MISLKVISEYCSINGFCGFRVVDLLPLISLVHHCILFLHSLGRKSMAEQLQAAIGAMSLRDDELIDLPDSPRFKVFEQNTLNLLGHLLNPSCLPMEEMIETMPRVWRVYSRVRGIALSSEKFQFIFEREEDMETVLKGRPWSFKNLTMLLD